MSLVVRQTDIAIFLLTIWQSYVAKFMWAIWCDPIAKQYLIGFVALIGLEGVNIVFSQVSPILLLISVSSIFSTWLLTIFFAPFLVAWDSNFLSCFYTFHTPNTTLYMHPHIAFSHYTFSWSKTLVGIWYKILYRRSYPVPPFSKGFLCKHLSGDPKSYLFFPSKSSNWTFLAWHKPLLRQRSSAWERNTYGISELVNKVDCFLSDDSCWITSHALFALDCIPAGSLHFIPSNSVDLPC